MSLFRDQRWADSVTIYHRVTSKDANGRTVTNWTRKTAEGVFYGLSKRQVLNGTVLAEHDRHICRIPGDKLDTLERGDVLCRGTITIEIPENGSPEKYLTEVEHFTASVVSDDRPMRKTAHWYASEA